MILRNSVSNHSSTDHMIIELLFSKVNKSNSFCIVSKFESLSIQGQARASKDRGLGVIKKDKSSTHFHNN